MRVVEPGNVRSEINVTPLVDVVLVLLITFMVVAPQLPSGPRVALPATDSPERQDDRKRIVVGIEHGGRLWIDDETVTAERFRQEMREVAERRPDWEVAIQGDARLTFGEVRQVLLAANSAGVRRVGLIANARVRND